MYDIIFWGHVNNGIDRYLPLITSLNNRGVKCLLFYQNYDFRDGLSVAHLKVIERYKISVMDYSNYLKKNPLLRLTSCIIWLFKRIVKCRYLYNKFIGLRSKLLQLHIDEIFISKMLHELKPKICFFDQVLLTKYCTYPYGSFYIKKISDSLKIRSFSISHGGTTHTPKINKTQKIDLGFDRIYEPNAYEKQWDLTMHNCADEKVVALGDPRFDAQWKQVIKQLFSEEVGNKIKKMNIKNGHRKILYLPVNLEQFSEEAVKYNNLNDIVKLCKSLGDTTLLIKPHPRYRNEDKIKKVMRQNGFKDFHILEDDPLICYIEHVDFIVSMGTTALYDALPKAQHKVVIYDNFYSSIGLSSVFKEIFIFLTSYDELYNHIKNAGSKNRLTEDKVGNVLSFCKKWIGADNDLNNIVKNITDDICFELHKK